jgi:monofunctional biosynthetic peptidoglycan transglycosylase
VKHLSDIWRWIRRHPFRTLLLLFVSGIVIELLTIPWFDVQSLATGNPPETALMRQRAKEAATEGKPLKFDHRWIPLSKLPRHFLESVIAAEDGTFYQHSGFDWFEIQESFAKNLDKGKFARGGSTITQQLAKNLYLSTSKDPIRKLKEALITVLLEHALTKQRILELYVNNIEWGRGIFGVESASQIYFHKSAQFLSDEDSYRLAAVIPSPLRHRPDVSGAYVLRRKAMVERRVTARRRGTIEQATEEDEPSPNADNDREQAAGADDTTATSRK